MIGHQKLSLTFIFLFSTDSFEYVESGAKSWFGGRPSRPPSTLSSRFHSRLTASQNAWGRSVDWLNHLATRTTIRASSPSSTSRTTITTTAAVRALTRPSNTEHIYGNIFLRQDSSKVGLFHIYLRHAADFQSMKPPIRSHMDFLRMLKSTINVGNYQGSCPYATHNDLMHYYAMPSPHRGFYLRVGTAPSQTSKGALVREIVTAFPLSTAEFTKARNCFGWSSEKKNMYQG